MSGSLNQRLGRRDQGTAQPPSCAVLDRTWAGQRLQPPKRRKVRRAYRGRIASPFDARVPVNAAGRVYGEPALQRPLWRPLPRETKGARFGHRDSLPRAEERKEGSSHGASASAARRSVASVPRAWSRDARHSVPRLSETAVRTGRHEASGPLSALVPHKGPCLRSRSRGPS
jgi:hypothetical protein